MTILDKTKSLYVNDENKFFNLGWILGVLAGLQIFFVGAIFYIKLAIPMLHNMSSDLFWKKFYVISFVGLANLINTGFSVIILCFFGLRRKSSWTWFLLLFMVIFVGSNDSFIMIKVGNFPFPLIPTFLGLISLLLTRKATFRIKNEK